jgi:hypothetical protein
MIKAAKISMRQGFKAILLSPYYRRTGPQRQNATINDHISKITEFSKKVEDIRNGSDAIVLAVGNEFTNIYPEVKIENLNPLLQRMIEVIRQNYKGRITYCSAGGIAEKLGVDWRNLKIDIVAPHLYLSREWLDENRFVGDIMKLKAMGKPIYASEFGCASYEGGSKYGGAADQYYKGQRENQEEQAQHVKDTVACFQRAGIDGMFLAFLLERHEIEAMNMGILTYGKLGLSRRKLGFYAYQSFVVAA